MAILPKRRIVDQRDLSDHEKKSLAILEIVRQKGPVARADIARLVDLNNVTVTSYVDQYLRKQILQEAGVHSSTGGRKPTLVDLDESKAFAIGVGLNAVDFIAILCDLKGKILHKVKIDRDEETNGKPAETILEAIGKLIRESNADVTKIHGIGVGVPGMVNQQNGTVRWPKGLLHKDFSITVSISNQIYERFSLPVILDNDANMAVFGEQWASERGLKHETVAYLYSGASCGLLIGGHIHRGASGSAGEFLFDLSKEDPIAWLRNAVETGSWGIDLGVTQRVRREMSQHPESLIHKLCGGDAAKATLRRITEAAEKGDLFSSTVLKDAGLALGDKAALLTNLLNPDLIIIGGGVEEAGIVFLDAVRQRIKDISVPEAAERVRVVPSQLGEDAVPIGAAALVVQHYFVSI